MPATPIHFELSKISLHLISQIPLVTSILTTKADKTHQNSFESQLNSIIMKNINITNTTLFFERKV